MNLAKKIIHHVEALPKMKQIEVLDFVEYLHSKSAMQSEHEWNNFSLTAAMRGLEKEDTSYSIKDLKESFA